jgi:hypothetical protein
MSHLSRDERLLAVDDALEASRAAHLASCVECRGEVDALRGVVARVRAVDVPVPAPLFWDHLAARVGDAIAREPTPVAAPAWWHVPQWGWGIVALAVVAAGSVYVAATRRGPMPPTTVVAQSAPAAGDAASAASAPAVANADPADPHDEDWALITATADETGLTPADAVALAPLAGQAELSLSQLSREERAALIDELEAELAPHTGREG